MSTATLAPPTWASIDDLMRHDGKAELINGRIVKFMAAGNSHNITAGEIFMSLHNYAKSNGVGRAYSDNAAFAVPQLESGRESFSPDAAYVNWNVTRKDPGPIDGIPTFAVEVRSPDDYGSKAERDMAAKREDYFEAGTIAVWDVNDKHEVVTLSVPGKPNQVFRRGEIAHAEPAVPGWTLAVDSIFAE